MNPTPNTLSSNLGEYTNTVASTIQRLIANNFLTRIRRKDYTLWSDSPDEITNRLGWLDVHEQILAQLDDIQSFVASVQAAGYTNALLLGMGGSSLAPEVFSRTFGVKTGCLNLQVLDSTDPGAVRKHADRLDPARTLFIVSSKSGTTVETHSFFKYFYNWTAAALGDAKAGEHFIAITDPGSKLISFGEQYGFRHVFQNDPNIGGRYSALSHFGMVPAALLGVDLAALLSQTQEAARDAVPENASASLALQLGAALGVLAGVGRDKLTLALSPEIESFGDWVEQLIAESTGKDGRGILPVVGEPLGGPEIYGQDRLFVALQLPGDTIQEHALAVLEAAGHPVMRFRLNDPYELGAQFFHWELATAVAGHVMGIQPFDQPNVESAKTLAKEMVASYHETGELPEGSSRPLSAQNLAGFLTDAAPGNYIALQAYVTPGQDVADALHALSSVLRRKYRAAVTVGFGPRFLHSTGQLHKGDGGSGYFVQFTTETRPDLDIPDEAGESESAMKFNVLKLAQALGDYRALEQARPPRPVVRFKLGDEPALEIQKLAGDLAALTS